MTEEHRRPRQLLEYGRRPLWKFAHVFFGVVMAWAVIFATLYLGVISSFESDKLAWWAIPLTLLAIGVCMALAWWLRGRQPGFSAGIWIGTGIGLIHAGLCYGPAM